MTQKANLKNMLVIFLFGPKILFDGYLIDLTYSHVITLIINHILFDGYLISTKH